MKIKMVKKAPIRKRNRKVKSEASQKDSDVDERQDGSDSSYVSYSAVSSQVRRLAVKPITKNERYPFTARAEREGKLMHVDMLINICEKK
jgi:hypothetical protein